MTDNNIHILNYEGFIQLLGDTLLILACDAKRTITAIVSLALSQIYLGLRDLRKLGMTDSKQNCPSVGIWFFFSLNLKSNFKRFETD